MRILVDADACPVKKIILDIAKYNNLEVIMFIDNTHILNDDYAKIITVDKGPDSVDLALINYANLGDIVITQDYGVAAMALCKNAYPLNQNGLIFTNKNIDMLLFQRHDSKKIMRSGGRLKNIKKRTKENNIEFEFALKKLIQELLN